MPQHGPPQQATMPLVSGHGWTFTASCCPPVTGPPPGLPADRGRRCSATGWARSGLHKTRAETPEAWPACTAPTALHIPRMRCMSCTCLGGKSASYRTCYEDMSIPYRRASQHHPHVQAATVVVTAEHLTSCSQDTACTLLFRPTDRRGVARYLTWVPSSRCGHGQRRSDRQRQQRRLPGSCCAGSGPSPAQGQQCAADDT